MRTVSFSQPVVRDLLNEQFVCAYKNIQGDPTAGQSIAHRPNDPPGSCIRGNGKQNVQTIFMTPDAKVFHVATGFLSPEDLADVANFAARLFRQMKQESTSPEKVIVDSHRRRLTKAGFEEHEIDSAHPMLAMFGSRFRDEGAKLGMDGPLSANGVNPFQAFSRGQFLEDQKFAMKYPLLEYDRFEASPEMLVGNGKSFFASSSSGSNR